jgi:hypothetical protein
MLVDVKQSAQSLKIGVDRASVEIAYVDLPSVEPL